MNILVDTSVWSLALLRKKTISSDKGNQLQELIMLEHPIFMLGIILQEILQGTRTRDQYLKLKRHLEPFPILPLERDDYCEAAELSMLCRRKGVQASTVDFLIAASAIRYNCHLLTADQDFERIADHCSLQLI
jgi:predicted nucleic acid-binding protein